jgi:predicted RNA-binding Zn-ribbon protein involved in translation (DUF1610 family)
MIAWSIPAMEAVMEHLIFVCPSTGREVDSGVESEIGTLLRIRQQNVRVLCPACGGWHQWAVRDAFLAKTTGDFAAAERHIA